MVVGSFRPFPAARPAGAARAGYLPLPAAGLVRGDARRATNPVGREIFGIAEPGFNRRVKKLATRAGDAQAAVTVLGRLPRTSNSETARLSLTDLRRSRMWGLNFDHAHFGMSSLAGARLNDCSLMYADLGDCDLRGVDLTGADLTGAMLWGADLTGANLHHATLDDAKFDVRTTWPEGFDPKARGCVLVTEPRNHYRRR